MATSDVKEWTEIIKNIGTALAIFIGGAWTLWRFVLTRERFAKVEFNLDIKIIGLFHDHYLVELAATIENKGAVRQYIREWTFDLLYLAKGSAIDQSREAINFQVNLAKLINKRPWVPVSWYSTFIDGGTLQRYTYLTVVPADTEYVSLYSRFIYPASDDFHSSQQTLKVQLKPEALPLKS